MIKNIKLLCPFHREKVASCVINIDKKEFHCFGCGESGKIEKLNKKLKKDNRDTYVLG